MEGHALHGCNWRGSAGSCRDTDLKSLAADPPVHRTGGPCERTGLLASETKLIAYRAAFNSIQGGETQESKYLLYSDGTPKASIYIARIRGERTNDSVQSATSQGHVSESVAYFLLDGRAAVPFPFAKPGSSTGALDGRIAADE